MFANRIGISIKSNLKFYLIIYILLNALSIIINAIYTCLLVSEFWKRWIKTCY